MAVERQSGGGPLSGEARLVAATLGDVEAVRLLLRGESVIDWHRLEMHDDADVDRFLRVNEFEPSNERDLERLEILREEAVEFLRRVFGFRIPDDVADGVAVRDLFLIASRRNKKQIYACIVLKVMHIIHHLAGRELLFRLPVSDDEIFHLVERKVVRIVEEVRAMGHPIVEFEWSRKPKDSLIMKLLAKSSTLAANIYDKLRFRMVLREERDVVPLLIELTHKLIPFNYVVPGESVNDIVSLRTSIESSPAIAALAEHADRPAPTDDDDAGRSRPFNEFSGPSYRIINFVADMPIRLDDFVCRVSDPANLEYGPIAFVLTEFQILDQKTAQQNEQGENSHDKYKERQTARVKQRLLRGLSDRGLNEGQTRAPSQPGTHTGNGGRGDDET